MTQRVKVKTILNKKKRRDPWFLDEYTINPFSACSFNCTYCYIRGSKYGEHMERKLAIKENAVELLDKQLALRAKKQQYGIIVLGSATDPYLHIEKEEKITRQILETILKYRFPLHLLTKSDLILRDIDLLHEIRQTSILPDDLKPRLPDGLIVSFSFSTVDPRIGKVFEPGAPSPMSRLMTMNTLSAEGLNVGVSMMPLLPYISDTGEHLELMFSAFKENGANFAMPATITLYGNRRSDSKSLTLRAVKKHFPEIYPKYVKLFGHADELPAFYRKAFYKKMMEMSEKYQLPHRII